MHVLVVEDNRRMAGLLKRGFEKENHRVTVTGDNNSGLEIAQSYSFDVIVLDVRGPPANLRLRLSKAKDFQNDDNRQNQQPLH